MQNLPGLIKGLAVIVLEIDAADLLQGIQLLSEPVGEKVDAHHHGDQPNLRIEPRPAQPQATGDHLIGREDKACECQAALQIKVYLFAARTQLNLCNHRRCPGHDLPLANNI